jgi:nitrogen fixation protein NifB
MAAERGIAIKVNSVLVPALNAGHLKEVAETVKALGATLMNIMPLKPLSAMAAYDPPDCIELERARSACETVMPQFKLCRQCRADAVGIPGQAGMEVGQLPLYH